MEKKGIIVIFFINIKMNKITYYERNRKKILNKAKEYCKNN